MRRQTIIIRRNLKSYLKCDQSWTAEIADGALQGALDKIDELDEENFRDAKSIIELLKENLTLWKEEEKQDGQQIDGTCDERNGPQPD